MVDHLSRDHETSQKFKFRIICTQNYFQNIFRKLKTFELYFTFQLIFTSNPSHISLNPIAQTHRLHSVSTTPLARTPLFPPSTHSPSLTAPTCADPTTTAHGTKPHIDPSPLERYTGPTSLRLLITVAQPHLCLAHVTVSLGHTAVARRRPCRHLDPCATTMCIVRCGATAAAGDTSTEGPPAGSAEV